MRISRSALNYETIFVVLALISCLVAVYLNYEQAMSGPFLLDDFSNLSILGGFGGVNSWQDIRAFVGSGVAGPTGRPVALLSFLIDDNAWPSTPATFKHTNVLLHILISLVASLVLSQMLVAMGVSRDKANYIAIFATMLWSVHPLHVSTVMYVVQRMAMLSMLFGLLAIGCYCIARHASGHYRYFQSVVALLGFVVCGVLGLYSKENVVVVIPMLWVMERYLFLPCAHSRWQMWMPRGLGLVSLLLIAYLLWNLLNHFNQPWPNRDYNAWQRLITQPQIIGLYLYDLVIPKVITGGIYHDSLKAASGLLSSAKNLVAVILISVSIGIALLWRKRFAWAAGVWLLFLSGHLIESTTLNLELYFEHRNYWPSLFLCFGVAVGLYALPRYKLIALAACIAVLCGILNLRTELWGNRLVLMQSWEQKKPQSERLKLALAGEALQQGNYRESNDRINAVLQLAPENPRAYFMKMSLDCVSSHVVDPKGPEFYELMLVASREYRWMPATISYLEYLFTIKKTTECDLVSYEGLHAIYNALLENKNISVIGKVQVLDLQAQTFLKEGFPDQAYAAYASAYRQYQKYVYLYKVAASMGRHHYPAYGLKLLEMVPKKMHEDVQYQQLHRQLKSDVLTGAKGL